MGRDRRWLPAIALLLIAAAFTATALYRNGKADSGSQGLAATGIVESDEVILGAEAGGRLIAVTAQEGDQVAMGEVVARLDDSLIQLQLAQATDPAARRQLELQADKLSIHSPIAGVISRVPAHVGEVVTPGQPIAAVVDLSQLYVNVYVPERDMGRVALHQSALLAADAFPGQSFAGTVTSINASAEFTPRNIQTQRDRQNLVFGVRVRFANTTGLLKPGLPVDVTFVGS